VLPDPDDDQLRYGDDPLDLPCTGPVPALPPIPAGFPPGSRVPGTAETARPDPYLDVRLDQGSADPARPPPGLLDLSLSWAVFTGESLSAGSLNRIGPITAKQARQLAAVAAGSHYVTWRVILTDPSGRAIAVDRVRPGSRDGPERRSSASRPPAEAETPIVGRVTIIMPTAVLAGAQPSELSGTGIRAAILRTAVRAAAGAGQQAALDRGSPGGCAHTTASAAYRPPPRIREFVAARDQTCRFPFCGQPAWRGDLDHTTPFDKGGRTCPCNLGALCRYHHQVKQLPGWTLRQPSPGVFLWTTPAGRSYTAEPDPHYG
jgi:hypothetical protein